MSSSIVFSTLVLLLALSEWTCADESENEIPELNQEELDYSKRLYDFGVGKRNMYTQYKRLPVFDFGLGKRDSNNRMYSFGLGKRGGPERMYSFGLGKRSESEDSPIGKRPISSDRLYGFGIGKRAADRMYSFGLGKRDYEDLLDDDEAYVDEDLYETDPDMPLDKRTGTGNGRLYAFGLGKRLRPYAFGLGKRVPPMYSFGLGKRANRTYGFGLGKRDQTGEGDSSSRDKRVNGHIQRFNFGLGKRDVSDQEAAVAAAAAAAAAAATEAPTP